MKFEPQTADQIASSGLLPDGLYDLEVVEASEGQSKSSGNDMITLEIKVFGAAGERTIYEYLVSNLAWKVRGAAEGFGLLAEYEMGELTAEDFLGKTGKANITTQPGQNGFKPKNVIKSYEPKMASAPPARSAARAATRPSSSAAMDDDIPFAPEFR